MNRPHVVFAVIFAGLIVPLSGITGGSKSIQSGESKDCSFKKKVNGSETRVSAKPLSDETRIVDNLTRQLCPKGTRKELLEAAKKGEMTITLPSEIAMDTSRDGNDELTYWSSSKTYHAGASDYIDTVPVCEAEFASIDFYARPVSGGELPEHTPPLTLPSDMKLTGKIRLDQWQPGYGYKRNFEFSTVYNGKKITAVISFTHKLHLF